MVEEKRKVSTGGRGIADYTSEKVVTECSKLPATQAEMEKVTSSKKVTNMVGTFLENNINNFQVSVIQVTSEKVASMVTTFLSEDLYGPKISQSNDHSREIGKGDQYGGHGTFLNIVFII